MVMHQQHLTLHGRSDAGKRRGDGGHGRVAIKTNAYLVAFPGNGDFFWVMAVTAVVAGVDLPVHEPRLIALLECATFDGVKRPDP